MVIGDLPITVANTNCMHGAQGSHHIVAAGVAICLVVDVLAGRVDGAKKLLSYG